MKIVLIGAHYPPEFTGGTEIVLEAQARELVRAGCRVRVLCGTDEEKEDEENLVPDGGHDEEVDGHDLEE